MYKPYKYKYLSDIIVVIWTMRLDKFIWEVYLKVIEYRFIIILIALIYLFRSLL